MLTPAAAVSAAADILPAYRAESDRLDRIDRYMKGDHPGPYTPRSASREYKLLAERSITNLLPLVVSGVAQALYVTSYTLRDGKPGRGWQHWQSNRMDARQTAIHRAALTYGTAYVTVLPGIDPLTKTPMPVIRGVSPRRMIAAWDDPAGDDWPAMALRVDPIRDGRWNLRLYDATHIYYLTCAKGGDGITYVRSDEHGAGVCPVVAFRALPDLEGRVTGEVEPLIPAQDRLSQTIFDLLVAQSFGSFNVRFATGMAPELDANGQPVPLAVDARRFLMAEDPDTRFGQLDGTPLGPLLDSADASMRHMAVMSQTPASDLLGQLANLSAEALAAARDGQTRRRVEYEVGFGENWEQVLQLSAALAGDAEGAAETAAEVRWRDMEARSLSQIVDALGKAATMLGIPPEALWSRIPGVTQTEVDEWKQLRRDSDPLASLADQFDRQARPTVPAGVTDGSEPG
ncbi:phage portal protein [Longispora albida]|uniref:phage portal protein n=1 Tax=Longispora albida TaxID=203523 RepID=UPI000361C684|nr:phage portal protein [Longispora albida]